MNDNGFKIICLECGSEDCIIKSEGDYGFNGEEECLLDTYIYVYCNKCGNTKYI